MMESFWHAMQLELLDPRKWETRQQPGNAIFEWAECRYNPYRRHSSLGMPSPAEYERRYHEGASPAERPPHPRCPGNGGKISPGALPLLSR
jgi:transposase InsO family protein